MIRLFDAEDFSELLADMETMSESDPSDAERAMISRLQTALNLSGKSPVAMALLLESEAACYQRRRNLLLTKQVLEKAGINRVSAYEALVALEDAGLIEVKRCQGRAPLVSFTGTEKKHTSDTAKAA